MGVSANFRIYCSSIRVSPWSKVVVENLDIDIWEDVLSTTPEVVNGRRRLKTAGAQFWDEREWNRNLYSARTTTHSNGQDHF